jgi:hypothetical protein
MATALLGFHCIGVTPRGNRTVAGFFDVAVGQQRFLYTAYPQFLVDGLWMVSGQHEVTPE